MENSLSIRLDRLKEFCLNTLPTIRNLDPSTNWKQYVDKYVEGGKSSIGAHLAHHYGVHNPLSLYFSLDTDNEWSPAVPKGWDNITDYAHGVIASRKAIQCTLWELWQIICAAGGPYYGLAFDWPESQHPSRVWENMLKLRTLPPYTHPTEDPNDPLQYQWLRFNRLSFGITEKPLDCPSVWKNTSKLHPSTLTKLKVFMTYQPPWNTLCASSEVCNRTSLSVDELLVSLSKPVIHGNRCAYLVWDNELKVKIERH